MFFPLVLCGYYIVDARAKEAVLLVFSLIFYAAGSLQYFGLFTVMVILTVLIGRVSSKFENSRIRCGLTTLGVIINITMLLYYKYTDFFLSTINRLSDQDYALKHLVLPLGISFFTFKSISYLLDLYQGKAIPNENPVHDALYLSFFGQIQSGPLTRYEEFQNCQVLNTLGQRQRHLFQDGVIRFLIGFNKKVLLADMLSNISTEVFSTTIPELSTAYVWFGSICYSLQLFYDFAGYSDMAIGISEMFGYSCRENFCYPYMTPSVSKFWRRWHISLGEWFRDYIYFPMGGSRVASKTRLILNLLVVWLLTGLWHGASWNYIIWGLGYFSLIAFEHITGYPDKICSKSGKLFYRFFALLFINCQWVLFRSPRFLTGVEYLKIMFVYQNNTLANFRTAFLIKEYAVFIIAALVLCFPLAPWISDKVTGKDNMKIVIETCEGVALLGLFVLALSFIISGKNNPFVYANF